MNLNCLSTSTPLTSHPLTLTSHPHILTSSHPHTLTSSHLTHSDRPLEDHELVRDVMAAWPNKNKPKLVLRQFATKNILWSPNPPVRLITPHPLTS